MAIKYDSILGRLKRERGRKVQPFEATSGQTAFVVTEFSLDEGYGVFVDGLLINSGQSRSGQTVTFTVGQAEGTEVIIIN